MSLLPRAACLLANVTSLYPLFLYRETELSSLLPIFFSFLYVLDTTILWHHGELATRFQ